MRTAKTILTLTTVGLTLIATPLTLGQAVKTAIAAAPVEATQPATLKTDSGTTDLDQPATLGPQLSEQLKAAIAAANQLRADFIKKQQELRDDLQKASEEDRAQIRASLQSARDEFRAAQSLIRENLKRKLADLKAELKQHQEIIDQAKDEGKDKSRARKDG